MEKNRFVKALLVLSILLLPLSAQAREGDLFLTVITKGGVSTTFFLSENPVVSYAGDALVVKSSKKEVSVPAAQVASVDLTGLHAVPTAVSSPQTGRPAFDSGHALMTGLDAGATVQMLSTGGQLLDTVTANANGEAVINLNSLPRGIVIVSTGKQTFKVTNK